MYSIYKIINLINGKIYIGQTCKTLEERFSSHIKCARRKLNRRLYDSMNHYGYENFKIELIEECDKSAVDDREKYWIKYYNSMDPLIGYNMSEGGGGGWTWGTDPQKIKEINEKVKQTKIKNGTWGKYWGNYISYMKGKHFLSNLPDRDNLLKDILTPLSAEDIGKKYGCCRRTIIKLAHSYFPGKTINDIRKEYNVKFELSEKRKEAIDKFLEKRPKSTKGKLNGMYKDVSPEEILSLISKTKNDLEVLNILNISRPCYIEKCKTFFGKLPSELRKEIIDAK